jgi:hypothetical protein
MLKTMKEDEDWRKSQADIFWAEIAPCDHVVQIYEDDENFINVLAGFVQSGIEAAEGVIIIATSEHIQALEHNLSLRGINTANFARTQYFALNAEKLLENFMVNGWPDEDLFIQTVSNLLKEVRVHSRKVRAFGEMVAVLWAQGHNGATVQLEHLWNKFCQNEMFCLFCAYPKSGFTEDMNTSMQHICSEHSKLLAPQQPTKEIAYRRMEQKKAV